jgi:hypothetical protein
VVSASEFGRDSRLKALQLVGNDLAMTEYIVCLAERRELRLVRAFLEIVGRRVCRSVPPSSPPQSSWPGLSHGCPAQVSEIRSLSRPR